MRTSDIDFQTPGFPESSAVTANKQIFLHLFNLQLEINNFRYKNLYIAESYIQWIKKATYG